MKWQLIGTLALLPFGAVVAVASATEPQSKSSGHDLFVEECGGCHLPKGFGTRVLARRSPKGQAELEQREQLPAAYTVSVVRQGLGSMPQIRAAELSDEELAAIARYLETTQ